MINQMERNKSTEHRDIILNNLYERNNKHLNYLYESQYDELLEQLASYTTYANNVVEEGKSIFKNTLLVVELNRDEHTNLAQESVRKMIGEITGFVAKRKGISYVVKANNFKPNSVDKIPENSVILIEGLNDVIEKAINNEEKISPELIEFLEETVYRNVLVLLVSDKNLRRLKEQLTTPVAFHFNTEVELKFDEIKRLMRHKFERMGFTLQKGWDTSLRNKLYGSADKGKKKDWEYVNNLLKSSEVKALTQPEKVIKSDFFMEKRNFDMNDLKSLKELENLIGMDEAKRSILELIAYLELSDKMSSLVGDKFPLNLHMMFTGSPGTGKTTIARVIAKVLYELGYVEKEEIVEVDKKDLVSQWVGHTAIKTNEIIQEALGGVLFIDEAYAVADDKYGKDAIATLIKAMEDHKSNLVVIVAGYKEEMKAFVDSNPGMRSRLGKHIHFDDYSESELLDIYNMKTSKYKLKTTDEMEMELLRVFKESREEENFGNGRFVDNMIQDLILGYAMKTQGVDIEDMDLTIDVDCMPMKYQHLQHY